MKVVGAEKDGLARGDIETLGMELLMEKCGKRLLIGFDFVKTTEYKDYMARIASIL
jgi:hypothetical protein